TIYLANFFKKNNINATIITNKIKSEEYPLNINQIKRISLFNRDEKFNPFKVSLRLHSFIKKEKPDALIVMGSSLINYAIPALKTINTKLIVSERNSPNNFSGKKITQILTQTLYPYADGYVFQTEEASEFYNIKEEKKEIIYNPLFIENLPEITSDKKEKNIINIGRLHPQKNQKLLIDAFYMIAKKHPKYNLIIYGEGSEREN